MSALGMLSSTSLPAVFSREGQGPFLLAGDFQLKVEEQARFNSFVGRVTYLAGNVGKIVYFDGASYLGEICNGMRHGKGTAFGFHERPIYIGQWENDLPHGRGRMTLLAGRYYYEGQFSEGVPHGKGKLVFTQSGDVCCDGEWRNGLQVSE